MFGKIIKALEKYIYSYLSISIYTHTDNMSINTYMTILLISDIRGTLFNHRYLLLLNQN